MRWSLTSFQPNPACDSLIPWPWMVGEVWRPPYPCPAAEKVVLCFQPGNHQQEPIKTSINPSCELKMMDKILDNPTFLSVPFLQMLLSTRLPKSSACCTSRSSESCKPKSTRPSWPSRPSLLTPRLTTDWAKWGDEGKKKAFQAPSGCA